MAALPDYLRPNLRLVFTGINPGTKSAATGHHYAGPGNHFWPLLYESGLVPEPLAYEQDARVLEWSIGLTNMVGRESRSISDLSLDELRDGARILRRKLLRYAPRVVCFNGKRIYEVFDGHSCRFGLQDERIGAALVYVMPSTSARTASHQRADKLRYFRELKRLVDGAAEEATAAS
ncbi:MAG: mismatch-specific DNA-glycosylase [Dehalococcoidia bacterium]